MIKGIVVKNGELHLKEVITRYSRVEPNTIKAELQVLEENIAIDKIRSGGKNSKVMKARREDLEKVLKYVQDAFEKLQKGKLKEGDEIDIE